MSEKISTIKSLGSKRGRSRGYLSTNFSTVHDPRYKVNQWTFKNHDCRCPGCCAADAAYRAQHTASLDAFALEKRREANRMQKRGQRLGLPVRRYRRNREPMQDGERDQIEMAIAMLGFDLKKVSLRTGCSAAKVQEVWEDMEYLNSQLA